MFTKKALAALAVLGFTMSATPVTAGEWKGTTSLDNPQRTPIQRMFRNPDNKGPSICAFSGLNDEYYLDEEEGATRTQSYGTLVADGDADPHQFNPGVACNMGE